MCTIGAVTFKGKPMHLSGRRLKAGASIAPDFKTVDQDMKEVRLSAFAGKIKLVSTFPSLDTPVCDMQVKEFNKIAADLSSEVTVIGISKDLPFAQKRFCGHNDIKNETILSDYRTSSFGINYGLLVRELNLLARAVLIIDRNDVLRYIQIVPEMADSPDYKNALSDLDDALKNPARQLQREAPSRCAPCEAGTPPLSREKALALLAGHNTWQPVEDKKIVKEFKFKDFQEARYFFDLIAVVAEEQAHHPTVTVAYNKVKVALTTYASGGLTDNDFIMAGIIDDVA